jgi:predicted nuclease of predicted toxin-antitoxin system
MRFLVDECLFVQIVNELRRAGHDVHWVTDDMKQADDETVLAIANSEQRILMSEDRDFGELVFRDRAHAVGIVSVRVSEFDLSPDDMGTFVAAKVQELGQTLLGQFTVVEPGRVRPRPLPSAP